MLIIAGHKQVRKTAGLAADYCPICRDFRVFEVTILRRVPHLYYVPLASGQTIAHELECTDCRSVLGVNDPGYTGYSKTFVRDVAELARLTNPDVVSRNRSRLEQMDRFAEGRVSGRERRDMIREPFEALDYMVQKRWGRGSTPVLALLAIAAAVLLTGMAVASAAAGNGGIYVAAVLALPAAGAVVGAAVSIRQGPRRWVSRHIHPRLAAALLPLDPTRVELSRALDDMRRAKRIIGKRVRAEDLAADLERARVPGRV